VIYGGDKPLREKIVEIVNVFESQGWSGNTLTEARTFDEFIKWYDRSGGKLFLVGFSKDNFHAEVIVADSRTKTSKDDCFLTHICSHVKNTKYPYIVGITYAIRRGPSEFKPKFTDNLALQLFLTPVPSPTRIPTPVVISTLTKDVNNQKNIYINKTYGYSFSFPINWSSDKSYDNTGLRFTNKEALYLEKSPLEMGNKEVTQNDVIMNVSVSSLNANWYMIGDKRYEVKTLEDLYASIHPGGGSGYLPKKYVTAGGLKAIETTGAGEGGNYFLGTQIVHNGLVYTISGFNYFTSGSWQEKYRQVLSSFRLL